MIPKNLILPTFDPKHIHSKYWLKYIPSKNFQNNKTIYTMYLASIQRGISSMVNSLGRNTKKMNVTFASNLADSASDNTIILHNPSTPKEIDLSVGMALHESSHLLLSQGDSGHPDAIPFYNLTKAFLTGNPKLNFGIHPTVEKLGLDLGMSAQKTYVLLDIIANFIEDVRVNDWVLSTSYGYREYYSALFEMLWHTDEMTDLLNSKFAQTPVIENYIGHILNMFNPNKFPVTLPEFDKIVDILDLEHVAKYGHDWNKPWTTYDNLPLLWRNANDILEIIYRNSKQETGESKELSEAVGDLVQKTRGNITEKQYIQNSNLTRDIDDAAQCNADVVMESAADMNINDDGEFPIVVYEDFNQAFIEKITPFSTPHPYGPSGLAVEEGIRMGNLLAHKIRMFQDDSREETLRQPKGRIDKRLLANIAHGDTKIFKETYVVRNKPIHVHISVDASSSMNDGTKWPNAIILCVALAKVADKIRNFDVTISMRSTTSIGTMADTGVDYSANHYLNDSEEAAAIGYVYDSRKDNFSKIRKLFPHLSPLGSTPEGVLYENIISHLAPISTQHEVIFINLSDGMPHMRLNVNGVSASYNGPRAHYHTQKKVSKMKRLGIHVLSYFMSHTPTDFESTLRKNFEAMYGTSAAFINPTQIGDVARSINQFTLTLHSKRS